MVPAHIIMMPALPLNKSGKVDKHALYPPPKDTRHTKHADTTAHNELERAIAAVWGAALGVNDPDVTANFFDLGGHSLLMVQVCSELKTQLACDVPVLMLFQYPTIRALAQALSEQTQQASLPEQRASGHAQRIQQQRARQAERAAQRRRT
jgi:acyl carrier protein